MLQVNDPDKGQILIRDIIKKIVLGSSLDMLKIKSDGDLGLIVRNVGLDRLKNNPRSLTEASLRLIVDRIRRPDKI